MEHPDLRFSTWRQQRAAEHLRQQHERHSILPDGTIVVEPFEFPLSHVSDTARHMPPGGVEPFFRKNSPHLRNADNSDSRETRKQVITLNFILLFFSWNHMMCVSGLILNFYHAV